MTVYNEKEKLRYNQKLSKYVDIKRMGFKFIRREVRKLMDSMSVFIG